MNLRHNTGDVDQQVLFPLYPLKLKDIEMIMMSFMFWTALYGIVLICPLPFKPEHVKVKKADELDAKNRIISFIHGGALMVFSTYTYYIMPGSCGDKNT